jgi:hypothetical protein
MPSFTFLKTVFVLGLSFLTPRVQSASLVLPKECHDLELIKGNPLKAKHLIFGDVHDDQNCFFSTLRCAQALTKHIPRSKKVALIEGIPSNMNTLCDSEMGSIVGNCRGWDIPNILAMNEPLLELQALMKLQEDVNHECNADDQATTEKKFKKQLTKLIRIYKETVTEFEKQFAQHWETYKKSHHKAKKARFYTLEVGSIAFYKAILNHALVLKRLIDIGFPYQEALILAINKPITEANIKAQSPEFSISRSFAERNTHYLEVIESLSNKEIILGFLGAAHVQYAPNAAISGAAYKQTIKDWHEALDDNAHERPSAILSCKFSL